MDEVIVNIEQGRLRGKIDVDINGDLYYAFLGIPYAKPPIGNLRFKVRIFSFISPEIYKNVLIEIDYICSDFSCESQEIYVSTSQSKVFTNCLINLNKDWLLMCYHVIS